MDVQLILQGSGAVYGISYTGGALPRLARPTLILPVRWGELALPDLQVYFWAAVLVTVRWWFTHSPMNAVVCLEAASLGLLMKLGSLVYRGPQAYPVLPYPTRTIHRIWATARKRFNQPNQWSPFTPLWGTSECACCGGDIGTYFHMFWSCPGVAQF